MELLKHKNEADILAAKAAAKPAPKNKPKDKKLSAEDIETIFEYLPWMGATQFPAGKEQYIDMGPKEVAKLVGCTPGQVKALKAEFDSVSEPEGV